MEQKPPIFLWKSRDIIILILMIIGLALLLVYGSKAVASAGDKRYVEGWRNRPFLAPGMQLLQSQPVSIDSRIMPAAIVNEPERETNAGKNLTTAAPKVNQKEVDDVSLQHRQSPYESNKNNGHVRSQTQYRSGAAPVQNKSQ